MRLRLFVLTSMALVILLGSLLQAQTNPSPRSLPYSQNFDSFNGSTTTYPDGIQGWTISGSTASTFPTAAPNGNAPLVAGSNSSTTAGVFDMNEKIGMLSTSTALRSIALSINTSGQANINVSYTAATQRQESAARIGAIGLQYRIGNTGTFINVDGTEYQNPGGTNNITGTVSLNPQNISVNLPAECANQPEVQLRWVYREVSGTGNRPSFSIDNISISGSSVGTPVITLNPSILTGFNYLHGAGPSAEQSFSVSGSNLTASITITPPANYEISTATGVGFTATNPVVLNHTGGTVAPTTIYVRLKAGLAMGPYNGELVTASSTGATNQSVSLSGSVTPPPTPTITISPTQLLGFQYVKGVGPSDTQTITVSATNLSGNLTITPPTDYEISSTATPFTAENPLVLIPTGNVISPTTLYIRLKAGLNADIYSQSFTASSPGASSVNVFVSGAVIPEVFTAWDFNASFTASSPQPLLGTGTATLVGSMTGPGSATGTVNGCLQTTGNAWAIGTANPGTINESSGVQFMVPTSGRENIWMAYDHRLSSTAVRTSRIQYTLNGTDWINLEVSSVNYLSQCSNRGGIDNGRIDASNPTGSNVSDIWGRRIINFSGIPGANNNPNFGVRIVAAHYENTGEFRQSNNVAAIATAGTWRFDNVMFGGDMLDGSVAVKLAVTSVNSGNNPVQNVPFTVTVQAQDINNVATNVPTTTQVTLTKATGSGILGGTLVADIPSGSNSITFNNVIYSIAETGVSLTATATSGMMLSPATSSTFTVLAPASQLVLVGVPSTGQVNTNLPAFTVEARRPDNSLDNTFSGNISLSMASGPGSISGTLTQAAVNGIATFNDIQFTQAGTYTLVASASGLTGATSGNITITDAPLLTEVLLPQYIQGINGINNDRIMYAYRVTLSNLLPSATYRYINQVVVASDGPTIGGAGNVIYVKSDGSFVRSTSPSLATAGAYGEFTTDANGSYTGWFVTEPTGNERFTPGNNVFMRIRLNNGANGTVAVTYLTTSSPVKVLTFGTGALATQGTALRSESLFTPGNFAFLYDNTAGEGRPLYGTPVEITGLDYSATTWAAFFRNNVVGDDGAFAAIIPNQNPNGVKLIQHLARTNGAVVNSFSSNNGQWGTYNTVNPAGGTSSVIFIDLKQGPSIVVSPTNLTGFSYVAGQGPSVPQSFDVSGTNLFATVTIDAPPAYEISLTSAPNFDPYSQISLSLSGTTLSPTTVYVRLKAGLSAGTYNELILVGSSGADPQQVSLQGAVMPGITEPANHATAFTANAISISQVQVNWVDAVPAASGYLIKGSTTGFDDISTPVDGVAEVNSTLVRNVAAGVQTFTFEGLNALTTYYFRIFPYNGSGTTINYKTDGIVPQASALTPAVPTMTEVLVPQYIQGVSGTNVSRIPYAFRVSLSHLLPNATYRFTNQAVNTGDGSTGAGAGNPIYVMPNGNFVRTTSVSFTVAGQYGEFTTDANGSYTGWFMIEPTGNARFTPGQEIAMRIRLNNGADGTTAVHFFTTSNVKVINFGNNNNPAQGTALRALSTISPKDFVFLYDATGPNLLRPVVGTHVEPSGIDFATNTSYPTFYRNNVAGISGAFGTIVPNQLPDGIRKIESYNLTSGQLTNSFTSDNGVWGNTNTVNPIGGLTNVLILNLDFTPVIDINPTTLSGFSYPEGQGPSAQQSFTVSANNLSAPLQLNAPIGYEISLQGGTAFSASANLTLNPVEGTVASTSIFVRLKQGLTAGTYDQQLTVTSAGASDKTLLLQGTVIPLSIEPPAHALNLSVAVNSQTQLTATWQDAVPNAQAYLIKGSTAGFDAIAAPIDGQHELDGLLVKNIPAGQQQAVFAGLSPETTYYFKLFPYNGTGTTINYKTDGAVPQASRATLGAPTMITQVLPQYIQGVSGTNNNRVPYAFRVRLQNLKPNSTYRYTNQAVNSSDGPTISGAGNPIYVNGNNFFRTTSPSFTIAGQYGTFVTDDSGSYSGWFMLEPTGNARFTPGNHIMMRLRLNNGEGGTTAVHYFTTEEILVINFNNEADAASGTGVRATSGASPRNFAFIYNNTAGSGRPLYGTSIETTGIDYAATTYPAFYRLHVNGVNGAWGGIVPNINPNGIRRIEERSLTTGLVVNSITSTDGFWGSINTANPSGGLNNIIVLDLASGLGQEKLAGQLKYFNAQETIIPSPNPNGVFYAQLFENGVPVRQRQLVSHNLEQGLDSYFEFGNLEVGKTYTLRIWEQTPSTLLGNSWTYNNWGGASSIDAAIISYMGISNPIVAQFPWIMPVAGEAFSSFSTYLADVNKSGEITGGDALTLSYRMVGQPGYSPFPGGKPNFLLSAAKVSNFNDKTYPTAPGVLFSPSGNYHAASQATSVFYEATLPALAPGTTLYNVYFAAVGDLNASYFDVNTTLKSNPTIITLPTTLPEISLQVGQDATVKAFDVTLDIGKNLNLAKVEGPNIWHYDSNSGILRAVGLFDRAEILQGGQSILNVRLADNNPILNTKLLNIELIDEQLHALKNTLLRLHTPTSTSDYTLRAHIWPNPSKGPTHVELQLPEKGTISLMLTDQLGRVVWTKDDQAVDLFYQTSLEPTLFKGSGLYHLHIKLEGQKLHTLSKVLIR